MIKRHGPRCDGGESFDPYCDACLEMIFEEQDKEANR